MGNLTTVGPRPRISDSLADGEWVLHFGHPRLADSLLRMVPAAVAALADEP